MADDLERFLKDHPESKMLNFSENRVDTQEDIKTIVIGCEGGFHEDEVAFFKPQNIIGLDTLLVLKSESAVCAVAAKLLL